MTIVTISYRDLPIYSLAAQQNSYRLFRDLKLTYPTTEDEGVQPILKDLSVQLHADGDIIAPQVWEVAQISPGQSISLQDRHIQIAHDYMAGLTDEMSVRFELTVVQRGEEDEVLASQSDILSILPANFWGGEERQPELLAAFVKPNGVFVESLVKQVTEVLAANGHGRSADGYQSNTREKPYLMAMALWGVISSQRISYVTPPPAFARQGQLIRMGADISNQKIGACLDLSVLFASCLELMGLNTVIALTREHAFVGVWLVESMFPLLTNDDPMELRKRADSRDLVLFETTMVTNSGGATFKQASDHARALLSEDNEEEFVYAIDIAQARTRKIRPLATVEEKRQEVESDDDGVINLPAPPPLPPVRADEQVREETPDTRIDTWQRKLLDLTKANRLLSYADRYAGIRIFCPDIGRMEDMLADGQSFTFLPAEASPVNDRERSAETFKLATGNDLHEQFALEQLDKGKLMANMPTRKLGTSGISLLRKAKTDLEEGGANTLFIALGMLSWKENPEDDRSYKAPLILIPVELSRKSASAPIRLKQLGDQEPLFNLTLIEFLQTEHEINLGHFREELPEDESGVDVAAIWQEVREVVSEHKGFEVLEQCVVASFSFAKYLMWSDLRERIDDLKENPFVDHLVERPQEAYEQDCSFLPREELDEKVDPKDIFIPLNCDSSQMVAVVAASKAQDFVLEGPPGTGKSETIANMIANNMAKGRKVLFVAEKIAALQVVYRRLEKIGLDHLALELHSNKTNKKAVLDQLRRATEMREYHQSSAWLKSANKLRERRNSLNQFVSQLHESSDYGISPREAVSRVAGAGASQKVTFPWGVGLSDCPVSDQQGLEELLETAKGAGIAFEGVANLDASSFSPITATNWSFAWQSMFVAKLSTFLNTAPALIHSSAEFAGQFGLELPSPTFSELDRISALSELIDIAQRQPIDFAIGANVTQRLENLGLLAERKKTLDEQLKSVAHGVSAPRLSETPIDEWISAFEEAQTSWWKNLFIKRTLNKSARAIGYKKFNELDILYALRDSKETLQKVEQLSGDYIEYKIWSGWESDPSDLLRYQECGNRIHELVQASIGLSSDVVPLLNQIKAKLVDGREFLDQSQLIGAKIKFDQDLKRVRVDFDELCSAGVAADDDYSLVSLSEKLEVVLANEAKLQPWLNWVASRNACESIKIDAVSEALEKGVIQPSVAQEQAQVAFCHWLAPRLIDQRDALRAFSSIEHDVKLEEFRQLDSEVARTTSEYIAALHSQRSPDINSKENKPHFGILSRELQKKTRHKPIRMLFEDMGERLLELCPCLMMSPMSVAQFLPSDFNAFDVVIFDEASQMTTWDSVGAIARGKNLIVVGDPKQMPPTNFFKKGNDGSEQDDEDMESILDLALAAGLPHRRLIGHYRSKHETLIAFSNSKYYDNALVTYPSSDTKDSAVTLRRVDGVYAKGTARNNPIEAKALVKEAVRRLKHPRLNKFSLGIVTINAQQQLLIEDLFDDARRRYPEIETFFQATDDYDPVFVKNLESVQGDERDVILFSLGYGPTEPQGRTMSMNFGPLNRQGGERRLNVAITRATTEVIIFSSFDSGMIDLSRTSATAIEDLKHYLEFAERGPKALAEQATAAYGIDQFDSEFEEAVAWALREKGWQVQTQIGVSKFRVDLGVVHPDSPGVFLAGVECDGATYHSSPTARDRDRTRQAVLEDLGWRLIRLWSTDYFRDPEQALEDVDRQLNALLVSDRELRSSTDDCMDAEIAIEVDLDSPLDEPAQELDGTDEIEQDSDSDYSAIIYYESSHKEALKSIMKEILSERPCITFKALALEVANRHGLSKTSRKQLEHLMPLLKPWAGILTIKGEEPTCWATPEDVQKIHNWRGLSPFGYERRWQEIAFPEIASLVSEAIAQRPNDPVDYICEAFELKRRAEKTLEIFASWVNSAQQDS